jgi:putative phosphoesterase
MGRGEAVVGVISDTHGLLRPEAVAALRGSDLVIHAGDVGAPAILDLLRGVAPVIAVRGNVDRQAWAATLPTTEVVEVGGATIYVLHDLNDLGLDARAAGFRAVIAGHSHRPSIEERDGVVFLNPGSAGPRRFSLPVTLARILVRGGTLEPTLVDLQQLGTGNRFGAMWLI